MKEIKAFKDALSKASDETAHFMTSHLRAETHASDWPSHISGSMRVSHNNGSFEYQYPEKHKGEIFDLEYGTEESRPTAAMRRFANRTSDAEHFLVNRISRHMGEL